MGKDKNASAAVTLLQVVLPILGTIAVAYFGYLGLKLQVETPIHATQTAEARPSPFAPTSAVVPVENFTGITLTSSAVIDPSFQPTEVSISPTTPIQPTPTLLFIASPSPPPTEIPISYADPVQFIQDYFMLLNNRQYQDAWSRLSSKFKQNLANIGGYDGYVSYWDTVLNTEIKLAEILSRSDSEVYVKTEVIYHYKAGYDITGHTTYKLVKDLSSSSWLIDPN